MIPPCPGFPLAFFTFPFDDDDAVDAGAFSFGGAASSSEKDSHTGASFVTAEGNVSA